MKKNKMLENQHTKTSETEVRSRALGQNSLDLNLNHTVFHALLFENQTMQRIKLENA